MDFCLNCNIIKTTKPFCMKNQKIDVWVITIETEQREYWDICVIRYINKYTPDQIRQMCIQDFN